MEGDPRPSYARTGSQNVALQNWLRGHKSPKEVYTSPRVPHRGSLWGVDPVVPLRRFT
jgi:hypothetical protein